MKVNMIIISSNSEDKMELNSERQELFSGSAVSPRFMLHYISCYI